MVVAGLLAEMQARGQISTPVSPLGLQRSVLCISSCSSMVVVEVRIIILVGGGGGGIVVVVVNNP